MLVFLKYYKQLRSWFNSSIFLPIQVTEASEPTQAAEETTPAEETLETPAVEQEPVQPIIDAEPVQVTLALCLRIFGIAIKYFICICQENEKKVEVSSESSETVQASEEWNCPNSSDSDSF